jgi:hypothetical protein
MKTEINNIGNIKVQICLNIGILHVKVYVASIYI